MGLAASQARFLGLTARKSNVEYQGQQINQARTALSNEVMHLYRRYNSLEVPVPPSKTDFTKTVYTLDSTEENYSIGSFTKITSGEYEGYYNVTLEYNDDVPKPYSHTAKGCIITAKFDEAVDEQGEKHRNYNYLNFAIGTDSYTYDPNDEVGSNITKIVVEEGSETAKKYQGLQMIMDKYGIKSGTFYMYVKNGVPYYTSEADLDATDFNKEGEGEDEKETYYGNYTFDYPGVKKENKTIQAIAALEQGKDGRLSSINIIKCEDDKDLEGNPYSITVSTVDDDVAYQDAMNKYNYKKDKYERQIELINKKTEIIQKEDRALELQLGQLDTEQNALKTEMESVSKVIEDTINSVFKTYNS